MTDDHNDHPGGAHPWFELPESVTRAAQSAISPAVERIARQARAVVPSINVAPILRAQEVAAQYVGAMPRIEIPPITRIENLAVKEMTEHLQRLVDLFREAWPENVRDLDRADSMRLHSVAAEQRIGIMWVPSAEVVAELMAASTADERAHVISERRAEIVASCRPRLVECDVPDLADLVALAMKAVDAFDSGHSEAAQALATTVLDTSVTQYFGPDGPRRVRTSIAEVKKMAARSGTDEEYWRYLLAITMAGIPPAWWDREYGSPDPSYSRGGTVHCADLTVYSPANAARALSLATCLLRWMKQNEDLLTGEDEGTAD